LLCQRRFQTDIALLLACLMRRCSVAAWAGLLDELAETKDMVSPNAERGRAPCAHAKWKHDALPRAVDLASSRALRTPLGR
jgi:hypothetical protein